MCLYRERATRGNISVIIGRVIRAETVDSTSKPLTQHFTERTVEPVKSTVELTIIIVIIERKGGTTNVIVVTIVIVVPASIKGTIIIAHSIMANIV